MSGRRNPAALSSFPVVRPWPSAHRGPRGPFAGGTTPGDIVWLQPHCDSAHGVASRILRFCATSCAQVSTVRAMLPADLQLLTRPAGLAFLPTGNPLRVCIVGHGAPSEQQHLMQVDGAEGQWSAHWAEEKSCPARDAKRQTQDASRGQDGLCTWCPGSLLVPGRARRRAGVRGNLRGGQPEKWKASLGVGGGSAVGTLPPTLGIWETAARVQVPGPCADVGEPAR